MRNNPKLLQSVRTLGLLPAILLTVWVASCSHKPAPNPIGGAASATAIEQASAEPEAIEVDEAATGASDFYPLYYCASPVSDERDLAAQALIGKTVPDLEDSTLLTFVYGGCMRGAEGWMYNWGPQKFDEADSVYMHVRERLGNDTLQIIYLRGELAITKRSHDFFNETALMLRKTARGWQVIDAYFDAESIDFEAVTLEATVDSRFMRKYQTSGTYSGGFSYASDEYSYLETRHLRGPSIAFTTASSNMGSDRCYADAEEPDRVCECYDSEGKVQFSYNPAWQSFVFSYQLDRDEGGCELKGAKTMRARQTWYMNADTAFLANGDALGEWSEVIVGKVNLPEAKLKQLLHVGE